MTGGGPSKDRQEVKMAYRLYPADGCGGMSGLPGMLGMSDPSEAEAQKVVSKAFDDVAKVTTDKLKSGK